MFDPDIFNLDWKLYRSIKILKIEFIKSVKKSGRKIGKIINKRESQTHREREGWGGMEIRQTSVHRIKKETLNIMLKTRCRFIGVWLTYAVVQNDKIKRRKWKSRSRFTHNSWNNEKGGMMAAIAGVISCASSDLIDYWGGKMIIGGEFIGIRVSIRVINALSYPYTVLSIYDEFFESL